MTTLPDNHPFVVVLAYHAETCDLGVRICADCGLFRDVQAQSAIAIAHTERDAIADWLARHHDTCVYCGNIAATRDHLVPRPWTGKATRRFVPTVPACADCNGRINDAPVFTIAGRAELVAASIRQKWGKRLAMPDRTPEELRQFTGRLFVNLAASQFRRQMVRRRLIVLDSGGAPFVPDAVLIAA